MKPILVGLGIVLLTGVFLATEPKPQQTSTPEERLHAAISTGGIEAGWNFLKASRVSSVSLLSHRMGEEMFAYYGFDAIALCPPHFLAGCWAGAIKSALRTYGVNALPKLTGICAKLGVHACAHGLGHGFPYISADLPSALALCDGSVLEEDRPTCWGGALQEYADLKKLQKEDMNVFCSRLEAPYRSTCAWVFAEKVWQEKDGLNVTEIAERCTSLDERPLRLGCVFGVGGLLGDPANAAESADHCDMLFAGDERYQCRIAVADFLSGLGSGTYVSLCTPLPDAWQKRCQQSAESSEIFEYLD